ncbi:MarR family transcriptional regulator [Vibrio cincinnatiensis]|jgi:DNA-binding MarR family transcriptional regulator|uniref:DNA-binding transcriptional regulator, MarR family n=1 Tax=Vibrio cincinnatiensis DSM 19608 TaxID=1123491 RepID=A0A1T4KDG7_VIBCI|nr:helix-turn-helix domain-containing protein [Vibrio cincinnatiensis]MCG3721936.1 MarR family transcriptional regulator [Vibrio cincinnatiensis]MCG3724371.1 MarR family transcriptional regulator [Vibrio cincinnatiensis]MCG3731250.1 MarR family transcriptional regulator [Vibrio cincinnatiensis]MCG3735028.1 MarR family transcriptional regulator [Vibrio cincinnatiensis]MCG3738763.1 MarR family transcriptional regulator [Vibrio cincinnatiensis]
MDLRYSLQRLEWHLWHHWREQAKHNGNLDLTSSELQYIYTLLSHSDKGLRLTELAELMKVSKASASTMVNKLQKQGYIIRKPCPEDARAQRLLPSPKMLVMQQYESHVYQSAIEHFQQTLTYDELTQLEQLLSKACRDLDLGEMEPPQLASRPY